MFAVCSKIQETLVSRFAVVIKRMTDFPSSSFASISSSSFSLSFSLQSDSQRHHNHHHNDFIIIITTTTTTTATIITITTTTTIIIIS
jgi:hypothetical protein